MKWDKRRKMFRSMLSKDECYFLYPNNYNRFVRRYESSFQHGGISMDEMIVPVGILTGKGK